LVRLQLYTVPGQVFYNATRKLVLNGVDGVVFVIDSQRAMRDSNLESLQNLEDNLAELGLDLARVPMVMQYNKRDLPDVYSVEEMDQVYNRLRVAAFPTIATRGDGLFEALKSISQMIVIDLVRKGLGRELAQPTGDAAAVALPSRSAAQSVQEAVSRAAGPAAGTPPPPAGVGPAAGLPPPPAMSSAAALPAPAPGVGPASGWGLSLWPAGDAARIGEHIDSALRLSRWGDVIRGVEQLVQSQARRWASLEGVRAEDPVAQFLLMRGVAPTRYRALWEAGKALRAGQGIGRGEAMSALVLALETVW
jgi:mutual gliding-motility protein MglA